MSESNVYKKMNAFRKALLKQDWTPDKFMSLSNNRGFSYVSAEKLKLNIGPLLAEHDLELSLNFHDLEMRPAVGQMSQHWTVCCDATFSDIETGESHTMTVFGEAGDSGDKGVGKAQTHAIKQVFFQGFLVADDGDPAEDTESTIPATSKASYVPPSEDTKKVQKEQVMANSVLTEVPKGDGGPTAVQRRALERITRKLQADVESGAITPEQAEKIGSELNAIKTSAEAKAFIEAHSR